MVKVRNRKGTDSKHRKKPFLWLGIALVLFTITLFGAIRLITLFSYPNEQSSPKAAIVDQLYLNYPNQYVTKEITQYLNDYGFQVDIYHDNDVTVDFYRNLAQHGYNLIIIRSHSGTMGYETNINEITGTYLFTTESYSSLRYPKEQISGEIAKASVDSGQPSFFAVGPKFITDSMKGKLDNTVVIIDGCSGLYSQDLANAFIVKGATAYLGWNNSVRLDYADEATLNLIKNLCSDNAKVAKAVALTMSETGSDPESHATLNYYPKDIGNLSVRELTKTK